MPDPRPRTASLTVLATTDLHSHVLNWDYFADTPYSDPNGNAVGLTRIATLVNQVRAERPAGSVLTVDNGDTLEGNPLAYFFGRLAPERVHPVATAMNAIGFDAAAIGNHEFNYGLEQLRSFESQIKHPLLCANATDAGSGEPAFTGFILKQVETGAEPLTVGILGLVTPGCAIWDRSNLAGRLEFDGIVEQAHRSVPAMQAAGAEVVIVLCHSGVGPSSSYGTALPWPENVAGRLAAEVDGIDAIIVGHAHAEIAEQFVEHGTTGRRVLLSEPLKWGMRLSVLDFDLERGDDRWQVRRSGAELLDAAEVAPDLGLEALVADDHQAVRSYVNSVVGQSRQPLSAARARFEASAVIDLINRVQALGLAERLTGAEWADLPVLSAAAAFNPAAALPAGPVSIRDVAGIYNYDNTLAAVAVTGADLRAYLEHAAGYYRQVTDAGPFSPAEVTNAPSELTPAGRPDYSYDMVSGLDAVLGYDIDIARPNGERIVRLDYDGEPVHPDQRFVLAMNNYRHAGGGGYPAVATAPVVFEETVEIRRLIIEWVQSAGVIDADRFAHRAWRLVADGQPVAVL